MVPASSVETGWPRTLLDVLVRAGLVAVLVVACYYVFHPFLNLMLWSVILAITLYPLQSMLRRHMRLKEGHLATLIVVVAIVLLVVPLYVVGASLAGTVRHGVDVVRSGQFHVPPPAPSVADWPLVGDRLFALWSQAATDLTSLAKSYAPQLREASLTVLGKVASVGIGLLMFFAALIIAGIFMAFAEGGERSAERIAARLFGPKRGPGIVRLCIATIRAVAQGVVGIAFIQMLLVGVGFALMGVPAAGLLALAVLLLGIMQVPASLVTIPVIVYVIATDGVNAGTIVFSIYVFVAGLVDNVLKPLLLGRGVEVPMPVVLIGALGGMVAMGIVGLFVGPVLLAVGYQLFWQWIDMQSPPPEVVENPPVHADEA
jgi:predicted PurR-regulated permease PerM